MDKWFKDILPDKDPYHNRGRDQMRKKGSLEFECLWQICGGIMFLPYALEDNIERKKTELNVVLNESLNTINKGNRNKVSSVGIIVFHVEAA